MVSGEIAGRYAEGRERCARHQSIGDYRSHRSDGGCWIGSSRILRQRRTSSHIYATSQGLAKAAAARLVLAKFNTRLTRGFSEREIATIAQFLQIILDGF